MILLNRSAISEAMTKVASVASVTSAVTSNSGRNKSDSPKKSKTDLDGGPKTKSDGIGGNITSAAAANESLHRPEKSSKCKSSFFYVGNHDFRVGFEMDEIRNKK